MQQLWDNFEQWPPLQRISVIFLATLLLIVFIHRVDKWLKKRQQRTQETDLNRSPSLKHTADGTLTADIPFWRYGALFFFLVMMLALAIKAFIYFYNGLPYAFWQHWDKRATLSLLLLICCILFCLYLVNLIKTSRNKVQLEVSADKVRYLRTGARGGILLSDVYIEVILSEVTAIGHRQITAGAGAIDLSTRNQKHQIILMLSPAERLICYRAIEENISKQRKRNK